VAAETVKEGCILQMMVAAAVRMVNGSFSLAFESLEGVVRPAPLLLELEGRASAICELHPEGC